MQCEAETLNYPQVCRFCLDPNSQEELITPCGCSGPNQYAHRSCLNAYRIFSNNPVAYGKCMLCGVDYTFKHVREHSIGFLLFKFSMKLIFQIMMLVIGLFLLIFVSGLIPYAIDSYSTHLFLAKYDEVAHFADDPYFVPRDLVFGLCVDCFILGIWSIIGMLGRCMCRDKDDDELELSHQDTERMGACCGLSICCMPVVYKYGLLSKLGCCYACKCCPNTVPNCLDILNCWRCSLMTWMCCRSCGTCCYVSPYQKTQSSACNCDCSGDCCADSCALCCIGCGDCGHSSNAAIPSNCNCSGCDCGNCGGGSGSGDGLGVLAIIVIVIVAIIICIGAIAGTLALIFFIICIVKINFGYVRRQADCEMYIIDNWDETNHPMPTQQPPMPQVAIPVVLTQPVIPVVQVVPQNPLVFQPPSVPNEVPYTNGPSHGQEEMPLMGTGSQII
ncbi:hypothetical protein EIN_296580 [Entamoeba invadens IP1]|uniref:RING-CH-type domain-containing protein n=1 Tax=Entamoeba invadens IP1 TaxID=370355 RepID=L7FKF3_ENTIV|nr:hypothetical protein EIN_296580 [Entamoeba invadens IP1]ELP86348.1 hypothetical protein EIN_296580 [Entamoeba invadens IP1]|eukprot:XP_004185694.1 hypothetical protein EIN_296580 [Entamoeba invadens IP1]